MTAKKASLLEKGVIKQVRARARAVDCTFDGCLLQDLSDTEKLLAPENVDREALQNYARQAADFSTNYQLPHLEFAVNHYGQPDVAMFDFTSMYAAEYASKVVERHGSRLLMILVGDSLLEVGTYSPSWFSGLRRTKLIGVFAAFLAHRVRVRSRISFLPGRRLGHPELLLRSDDSFRRAG